jgi:predicted metal-dependent peptidase
VYLIDCDSAVHSGRWVGPFEALPLPRGGGGTDFRPVFRHLIDERIAADLLVYLTDGMGEFGDDPGIPTIWVMTTDARPPWGEFVQMGVDA